MTMNRPSHFDPKTEQYANDFAAKIIFFNMDQPKLWSKFTLQSQLSFKWNIDIDNSSQALKNIFDELSGRIKTYVVDHHNNQYAASHYILPSKDLNPDGDADLDQSKNKFLKLFETIGFQKKCYIFGTGPSLSEAYQFDYSDGLSIACNSMIKNETLMEYLKPKLFVCADPVFHSGCSTYAAKFRETLCSSIDKYDFSVIIPFRDYKLFKENLPDRFTPKLIGVPLEDLQEINLNLEQKFKVKSTKNVLTLLLIPLACTFADQICILGCDGRNLKDDQYYWTHHKASQFNDQMDTAQKVHPSFFSMVNYNDYYLEHCELLEKWISKGEEAGKVFRNLTPSHIPVLTDRLI
jgi:hypothetical protein